MTAQELVAAARRLAPLLDTAGDGGPIVPIYMSKSLACVVGLLAIAWSGRAFACLNRKLRPPQIAAVMRDAGAETVMVDGPGLFALRDDIVGLEALNKLRWIVVSDGELSPMHAKAVARLSEHAAISCHRIDASDSPEAPSSPDRPRGADRYGCCLFTSGSTGIPKGVLIGAEDLDRRSQAEVDWYGIGPGDALLSVLPFSFDVGLNQLLSSLAGGAQLVLSDSWLPTDMLRIAADFNVTGISAVPAIWRDFITNGIAFDTAEAHRALRYITLSGGDLSPPHLAALPQVAPGVGIIKTYGQTETFRSTCLLPDMFDSDKQGSVGRAFADARIYVVDEHGAPCRARDVGQVVHTGLGTMLGYVGGNGDSEKLVANMFHGADDAAGLAVLTGDYGYLDEDGYLFLKGRQDDMLKISGNRVYPGEVVHQLLTIDSVREAEVVDVRDDAAGTRLVAFAVAAPAETEDGIKRKLAKNLPSYMVPHRIFLLDVLPRLENGKSNRVALRERAGVEIAAAAPDECPEPRKHG